MEAGRSIASSGLVYAIPQDLVSKSKKKTNNHPKVYTLRSSGNGWAQGAPETLELYFLEKVPSKRHSLELGPGCGSRLLEEAE